MTDGLLLIDKAGGMTSHDVVARVRRILNTRRVGHAGTLDPLATGLLVLLVGKATRLSDYLLNESKVYETTVELGRETDSLDADGSTVSTHSGELPSAQEVVETALSLRGVLDLAVPQISAVKVDGKKLYEYARQGVEMAPIIREMFFERVEVLSYEAPFLKVRLGVSKGTYIRSWAAELGRRLGCGGLVSELRRVSSGAYSVDEAVTLEVLESGSTQGLVPLGQSLRGSSECTLGLAEASMVSTGRIPGSVIRQVQTGGVVGPYIKLTDLEGDLLAVLKCTPGGKLSMGCVLKSAAN